VDILKNSLDKATVFRSELKRCIPLVHDNRVFISFAIFAGVVPQIVLSKSGNVVKDYAFSTISSPMFKGWRVEST